MFLPFPGWQKLVSFISSASALMFAYAPISLAVLRRSDPDRERPVSPAVREDSGARVVRRRHADRVLGRLGDHLEAAGRRRHRLRGLRRVARAPAQVLAGRSRPAHVHLAGPLLRRACCCSPSTASSRAAGATCRSVSTWRSSPSSPWPSTSLAVRQGAAAADVKRYLDEDMSETIDLTDGQASSEPASRSK